ncbi:zinc finger protein 16 [Epinephelus fuscoguttatus]|uniref:zinc finger protein 16 n=1 Tax=Epinephelus fuscoguttatus TaxID=293821 RepID=UPI0020D15807|nr:zinc finger protein 16 [Epinephelus fuscoguttatus]
MSEDSSSDEEWGSSTEWKMDDSNREGRCWECGKKFSKMTNLMLHYKSHDIKATCYICEVTFRRLTSLSMHLENVHLPPLCKKCPQAFGNVWDLNKHAETHYTSSTPLQEAPSLISEVTHQSQNSNNSPDNTTAQQSTALMRRDSVSELRSQQRIEVNTETSENSVEYTVGEDDKDIDMESDGEKTDDSASSESDDKDKTRSKLAVLRPADPETGSSSTNDSTDSSSSLHSKKNPAVPPNVNSPMCAACGRGPFRSMKLHLLHCSGVRVKYQCSVCKNVFVTEKSLKEHYMPLYTCEICGQVFPQERLYHLHQCPKTNKPPLALFCSESLPQACNICKCFFTSEKYLLGHVTRVHTSVVSTKVCIITNPSALAGKKVSPGVRGTAVQSAITSPHVVSQLMNGKLCAGQTYAGSLSTAVKSSPSSLLTSSSYPGRPLATICMASAAAPIRSGEDFALAPNSQLTSHLSAPLFVPSGATDTTPSTEASNPVTPPMPTILAMFQNDSHDVALMKRMNTGWRSKAAYPCRQCGAIFRQPSLIISHRYLHRGHRSHQCQCGRAFKHRLHLLRHCVQHAETVSYICVSCGETFTGAKLLAEHVSGKSQKKSRSGRTLKCKAKRECRIPFTCDCGQLFFRPSAYIWHQLKNRTKTKRLKKPLE